MASSMSAAASSGSDGEPGPKRRRLLDAGGPIEDDETARQKMRDAKVYERVRGFPRNVGFDPDNVGDMKSFVSWWTTGNVDTYDIKPMGYFANKGDLPMMRWLYVNGADTRDVDVPRYFPMHEAGGIPYGNIEMCKWLFAHGAAKDINRRTPNGRSSPLHHSFLYEASRNLIRWFILNGALCKDDDSGDLDAEAMKQDLGNSWQVEERKVLLEWATDLHRARTSFYLFLQGALPVPMHATSTHQSPCPLKLMGGNPGIFETIGAYVGIHLGREARIIRQLTEMLPKAIAEFHVDNDSSGESSSDE